jgi:uncharacterized protein
MTKRPWQDRDTACVGRVASCVPSNACSTVLVVTETEIIDEIGRRLAAAAPAGSRIVLFGSRARGEADNRSDYDVLVVEPAVDDTAEESVRLRRTLRGLGLFADVVVVSEREVEEWREVPGSFIHAALSEGRAVAA